ncbi:membrane protein [Arsukibacterium ikkense]|uniref:Membrane protein n=2 Tax=Arsukibacterium ikkense TaxID=336831 RepID=A0A0M2V541_9GAMM|nr:membrane protein [Arsukibacterium ikkense]
MLLGIALIIIGHYLWVGLDLPQTMGVSGIMLVAACCALGLLLSLPTKIYLTLLLMQHESDVKAAKHAARQEKEHAAD